MTPLTWAFATQEAYRRTLERLVYLGAMEGPALLIDLWEDPDQAGHPHRAAAVVTVRPGVTWDSAEPFIPWAGVEGLAWETEPAQTPAERFMVAMEQGHLRARERLTGESGLAILPR